MAFVAIVMCLVIMLNDDGSPDYQMIVHDVIDSQKTCILVLNNKTGKVYICYAKSPYLLREIGDVSAVLVKKED